MKNDASTLALTQIADLVFSRDFGEARRRARELWARLFASADADPVLRGWAEREGHAHVQRLLSEACPRSRRNGYATLRLA